MKIQHLDYWREVVKSYVRGEPPPSVPSGGNTELGETGNRIHVLEMLDYLVNRSDGKRGALPQVSRNRRARNIFDNQLYRNELERIASKARSRNLRYAWLKGGEFLRRSVYPKGLRRLSDLDMLLWKEDLREWDVVFKELGYGTHRDPDWILSDDFDGSVSSTFYTKSHSRKDLLIDVHWHLVDYPARRACGRWDFPMESVYEGIHNHALSPEHRVLYLIDHAFTHEFKYWKFVTDLDHLLENQQINWSVLREEAARTNLMDTFDLGVGFLKKFFGGYPPENFVPLLENSECSRTSAGSSFSLSALRGELPEGAYLKQSLRWLKSLPRKVAFLRYVLAPPWSAVPMIPSEASLGERFSLYARRLNRVIRKGPKILES